MARTLKFIVSLSLLILPVFLWINPVLQGSIIEEEAVKLIVGETKVISTRLPSRVLIVNPKVADIADVTNTEITLSAKAPGLTTLVFWDAFGEQSVKIKVLAEDTDEIKRRIDNLLVSLALPGVYTKLQEDEGKIFLLGTVKTPQDRERVSLALGTLKEKTVDLVEIKEEEAAVEIDVQILELDKDATDTLGFSWPGSITLTETGSPSLTGGAGAQWATLFRVVQGTRAAFTLKLDALIQEGKARILSRPRLACQSGKEAELMVGGEKPVFTTAVQATVGTSTSVEYKEFGIKLKIKPTINKEERIKLALNVEVSDVGEAETIGPAAAPTAKAYPLIKRTASTELFLNDGQTMAIGGLIKQKSEEDLRKFPWLGDIPVLGLFFRQRITKEGGGTTARGNTELFITLTPKIVGEEKQAKQAKKEIGPVIAPPALRDENISTPLGRYARLIQRRITDNLTYPPIAKETGFQGTVKLSLHLSYLGALQEAVVKNSSGYKILDDNAVSTATSISSYPPFPSSIQQEDLWVDIPIVYKLD